MWTADIKKLRLLSYRTLFSIQWQCNYDTIDATRYMPHTPEVIYCDHMHCFSMNVSPDKEDTFVVWLLGLRIKKEVTRREY